MIRKITKISNRLFIGPKLTEERIEKLSEMGISTVVNLSKKGEFDQKLTPEAEGKLLKEAGIEYIHIPVSVSNMKHTDVDLFLEATKEVEGPLYMHCLFGQRCGPFAMIYHGMRKKLSIDKVLQKKEKLGLEWKAPSLTSFVRSYFGKFEKAAA